MKIAIVARVAYLGVIVSIALLAATTAPSILSGGEVRGWRLLFHLAAAGLLVGALPALALSGGRHFWKADAPGWTRAIERVSYLGILVAGVIVIATIVVAMFPWLETEGLREAIELHRGSGMALVAFAGVHVAIRVLFRGSR